MSRRKHIDDLLKQWPYEPQHVNVRTVNGKDGRELLQMRVDMGVLQLEIEGRPDGGRPHGAETYYDYLIGEVLGEGRQPKLDEEQCVEVDREFVQFYHRRVCWLKLQRYRRAVEDADHTLGLMDLCREFSPDDNWTLSHEQYRPFVLFHRTQAAALAELEDDGPESAVQEIDQGIGLLRTVFAEHGAEEVFENDELIVRLGELRESLTDQFDPEVRLRKQLAEAVAAEQYELAAELRDKLQGLGDEPAF